MDPFIQFAMANFVPQVKEFKLENPQEQNNCKSFTRFFFVLLLCFDRIENEHTHTQNRQKDLFAREFEIKGHSVEYSLIQFKKLKYTLISISI